MYIYAVSLSLSLSLSLCVCVCVHTYICIYNVYVHPNIYACMYCCAVVCLFCAVHHSVFIHCMRTCQKRPIEIAKETY